MLPSWQVVLIWLFFWKLNFSSFFFLQLFKIYHFKDDVDDSNNESTTPGTECNNCESIDKENIDSCNANDTLEMSRDDSSLTAVNDNSSDNISILYQRIPTVMENGIDKKISKSRAYLEAATICREEAKRFIDENDFGLARSHCLKAFDILKDIHVDDDIADSEKMMGYQDCCSFFRKVSLLLYILSYHTNKYLFIPCHNIGKVFCLSHILAYKIKMMWFQFFFAQMLQI